jgi:hypothetical protein
MWVRLGKARGEHNESGVPQKVDVVGTLSHFRVWPRTSIALSFSFRLRFLGRRYSDAPLRASLGGIQHGRLTDHLCPVNCT